MPLPLGGRCAAIPPDGRNIYRFSSVNPSAGVLAEGSGCIQTYILLMYTDAYTRAIRYGIECEENDPKKGI